MTDNPNNNPTDKAPDSAPFGVVFPEGTPDKLKDEVRSRLARKHRLNQLIAEAHKGMMERHADVAGSPQFASNGAEAVLRFQAEALAAICWLRHFRMGMARWVLSEDYEPNPGETPEDVDMTALGFGGDVGELRIAELIIWEL